nr:flagellar hook-length control protein FliK [uncultured Vibrio sp.]
MNVNLSNAAATTKLSVSESGAKASTESSENKGFFATLAGVFADSHNVEVIDEKLTPEVTEAPEKSDEASTSSVESAEPDSEIQETVAVDGKSENQSTEALLDQDAVQAEPEVKVMPLETRESGSQTTATSNPVMSQSQVPSDFEHAAGNKRTAEQEDATSEEVVELDVTRSMDEGLQLLGRIVQANQALNPVNPEVRGKSLPPESTGISHHIDTKSINRSGDLENVDAVDNVDTVGRAESVGDFVPAAQPNQAVIEPPQHGFELTERQEKAPLIVQPEPTLEQNAANIEAVTNIANAIRSDEPGDGDMTTRLVQRVSIDELEVIDTKLAQGKRLTNQEVEIIDGLKTGDVIAELPEEEVAQLVALPSDVKTVLSESQTAQHNTARQMVTTTPTPQVTAQELKNAAGPVPTTQTIDKTVLPAIQEGLTTTAINPAIGQTLANTEASHKAMNSALAAGILKATTDKQDKTEPQPGLAGQLQAAVSQQGVTTPQQARIDAAQQAQLPLQLTKELANDQVAEKVQMMMSKNLKNLDIRLDPPELGRMQIRMTMNSDLANVHFTVTNPQARDIIEQTLPRLREMLAQQGVQLADASVQQQNSGQQQSGYTAAEQNRQGSIGRGFSAQSEDGLDTGVELNVKVSSPRDGISFYA